MKICFLGTSHAAAHLAAAAEMKGFKLTDDICGAELLFVSEDTPTDESGNRSLTFIRELLARTGHLPVVLTSQVPPGFTRSLDRRRIFYQAETLRIKDAMYRAMKPEQIIVGKRHDDSIPAAYIKYLMSFNCPVHWMSWEDAEFAKIAINMYLASQIDTTNRLKKAAEKCGASWDNVKLAVDGDSRIGDYTTPGRWQDSVHLLRDYVTLKEIEDAR